MPLNAPVSANSRAVICHPLDLATHLGLKTYNRTFRRVEAGLFLADVVAHLQGRASAAYAAEIAQVNVAIARELDRLAAVVEAQTRWIEHVVRKAARPSVERAVRYTQPARVELAMRTPKVRCYAELLAQLEQLLRALDAAWYAGVLDTPAQLQAGRLLFRHFHRACGVVERLARGLARRVRDAGEAPGYRDMLVKRTGRGPERAEPPAPVTDEGAETMTADEAASLRATEALVADLSAAPAEPANAAGREASAPVAEHPAPVAEHPAPVAEHPVRATGLEASAPAVAWAGNPPAEVEVAEEESPGTAGFAPGAAADETSLAEPRATTGTRPRRLRDVLDGARVPG